MPDVSLEDSADFAADQLTASSLVAAASLRRQWARTRRGL